MEYIWFLLMHELPKYEGLATLKYVADQIENVAKQVGDLEVPLLK